MRALVRYLLLALCLTSAGLASSCRDTGGNLQDGHLWLTESPAGAARYRYLRFVEARDGEAISVVPVVTNLPEAIQLLENEAALPIDRSRCERFTSPCSLRSPMLLRGVKPSRDIGWIVASASPDSGAVVVDYQYQGKYRVTPFAFQPVIADLRRVPDDLFVLVSGEL